MQQALLDWAAIRGITLDLGSTGPAQNGVDGVYGEKTAAAVKQFKAAEGLGFEQLGDVGPGTMRRLNEIFDPGGPQPPAPPPPPLPGPEPDFPTEGTLRVGGQVVGQVRGVKPGGPGGLEAPSGPATSSVLARRTLARLADPTGKFVVDIARILAAGEEAVIDETVIVAEDAVVIAGDVAAVGLVAELAVVATGVLVGVGLAVGVPFAIARAKEVEKSLGEFGRTLPPGGLPKPKQKDKPDEDPPGNRGNIHAQGPDVDKGDEPNFSWNQPIPMSKVSALAGLEFVKSQCTRSQRKVREDNGAFDRAERFIRGTLTSVPPSAPVFRAFGARFRVDIEIIHGTAFE